MPYRLTQVYCTGEAPRRGAELPLCVGPEQGRVRHWMCKYKTSSREFARAAFADTFQIEEWIIIFIGDASTDFLVVCFAL